MNQAWMDRAEDLKQAFEAGEKNLTRLAARFGTSRHTVRRSLKYKGIIANPSRSKRSDPDDSLIMLPKAKVIGPYSTEYFGTIPEELPERAPLEELKRKVSEFQAKLDEIDGKIASLEKRIPVFNAAPFPPLGASSASAPVTWYEVFVR